MAIYAIGDIQGCYFSLLALLKKIDFDREQDTLWLVGDLVNRGPHSLEVLRFIADLPHKICVLGNHDIHLLGVYFGVRKAHPKDTFQAILAAPDRERLIQFLLDQPLFHWDRNLGYAMVHAGIHPSWSFEETEQYAQDISHQLRNPDHAQMSAFLRLLFGDQPKAWQPNLEGQDRSRFIVNCLTRMRLCNADHALRFDYKGTYERRPPETEAWFNLRTWRSDEKLIFGHWAALMGDTRLPQVFGLDTGCVWGQRLTALRLPDAASVSVKNQDTIPITIQVTGF